MRRVRLAEGSKDRVVRRARVARAGEELLFPRLQADDPVAGHAERLSFVGDVVGPPREGVSRRQIVAKPPGQEPRADREVLVVRAGNARAVRICGRQLDGARLLRRFLEHRAHAARTALTRPYSRRSFWMPCSTNSPVNPGGGSPPASSAPANRSYSATSITVRSEEHTSELQSRPHLVCRLLLEKKTYSSSIMS